MNQHTFGGLATKLCTCGLDELIGLVGCHPIQLQHVEEFNDGL
jgi:hypothetical protein